MTPAVLRARAKATKPRKDGSLKQRKCRICREGYRPMSETQEVCTWSCGLQLTREREAKALKRKRLEQDRAHKIRKLAIKPRSKWLQEAQQAFNGYIRARDHGKPCISSGVYEQQRFTGGHFDAGHYRSTGAAAHLRFNTWNCHAQSKHDNRDLSGNLVAYRLGLIQRIGLDRVESLEHSNEIRSFDIEYLKRIKKIFTTRARHLKKLRGYV